MHNELAVLSHLKELRLTPKVHFACLRDRAIYMDYVDGMNLKRALAKPDLYPINPSPIKKKILEAVRSIHAADVLLVDVHAANVLIVNEYIYFVDFADAVTVAKFPFANTLKREELKKLHSKVLAYLS